MLAIKIECVFAIHTPWRHTHEGARKKKNRKAVAENYLVLIFAMCTYVDDANVGELHQLISRRTVASHT
jgi:hypothetical protein